MYFGGPDISKGRIHPRGMRGLLPHLVRMEPLKLVRAAARPHVPQLLVANCETQRAQNEGAASIPLVKDVTNMLVHFQTLRSKVWQ